MPDSIRFAGGRKAAKAILQFADLYTQALVDRRSGRPAAGARREFVRLRHLLTVPNIIQSVRLPQN